MKKEGGTEKRAFGQEELLGEKISGGGGWPPPDSSFPWKDPQKETGAGEVYQSQPKPARGGGLREGPAENL